MRPAIATVVTTWGWEARLTEAARATGLARVVRRCGAPGEVDRVAAEVDVVVAGAETPWLSAPLVGRWRGAGLLVAGMASPADPVAGVLLGRMGCNLVLSHTDPPVRALATLIEAAAAELPPSPQCRGKVVTVTGPRGAPGRSEVATALAWAAGVRGEVLLAELDCAAPSLGLRLGLPPSAPEPAAWGKAPRIATAGEGGVRVLAPPARSGPLSEALVLRLLEAGRCELDLVVLDTGPDGGWLDGRVSADERVVVCDPTPVGLVRTARMLSDWEQAPPYLVVNRAPEEPRSREAAIRAVRAATGLEPAVVVPTLASSGDAARRVEMVSWVRPLLERVTEPQRAAR